MTIEIWVVVMPEGDRPYARSSPPRAELAKKWKAEGGRIFRLTGFASDTPGGIPPTQIVRAERERPDLGEDISETFLMKLPKATIVEL